MRMRQSPGGPAAHRGGHVDSRVRVSAVSEPFAGRDEQLGQIFINMRRAMNVSRETIARRLATHALDHRRFRGRRRHRPAALEGDRADRARLLRAAAPRSPSRFSGASAAIWTRWPGHRCAAPRPARCRSRPPAIRPNGMPATVVRTSERARDRADDDDRPPPSRRRRRMRTLFTLTAPVALLAGIVYSAQAAPQARVPGDRHAARPAGSPGARGPRVPGAADRAAAATACAGSTSAIRRCARPISCRPDRVSDAWLTARTSSRDAPRVCA